MSNICMRIKENKKIQIYLILALIIILTAVFAEYIVPHSPYDSDLTNTLAPPSAKYPFGTDHQGRCVFSRVLCGASATLQMTFFTVFLIFIVGTALGVVSGYFCGWVDVIIMRLADIMIAFPGMILAIAIAGIMGGGLVNAVFAIAAVNWPRYARLSRSLVLKIKENVYIEAARVSGTKPRKILTRYIIPNFISNMVITAGMDIGVVTMELAGLSYLGLGAQPPVPEWGLMLSNGKNYLQTAPWLLLFPGLAIFITIVIFNLLGEHLRDVLDPHSQVKVRGDEKILTIPGRGEQYD